MTETMEMINIINKNKEIAQRNVKRKKDAGTSHFKKQNMIENINFSILIISFLAFFDILSKLLVK